MSRRAALLGLLLVASCKGLDVDQGNDFPCDFSQPPGVRDQACAPGEICGVLNKCQRFVYEGPQFEGVPTRPDPTVGGKVHPLILERPVQAVVVSPYQRGQVTLAMDDGTGVSTLYGVDLQHSSTVTQGDPLPMLSAHIEQIAVASGADAGPLLLFTDAGDDSQDDSDGGAGAASTSLALENGSCVYGPNQTAGDCLSGPRQLRSGDGVLGLLRHLHNNSTAGAVDFDNHYLPFSFEAPDAGGNLAYDFIWAKRSATFGTDPAADGGDDQIPVVLTPSGFWTATDVGLSQWVNLLAPASSPELLNGPPTFFRRNDADTVWAMGFNAFDDAGVATGNRLSTWLRGSQIVVGGVGFAQAWSDCTPCAKLTTADGGQATGTIVGVAPVHDGAPGVEVLCSVDGVVSAVTVTGSTAAPVSQSCLSTPLTLPFDATKLQVKVGAKPGVSSPVQDLTTGFSVALGGQHGEVWTGLSFSTTLPLFLERVPLATGVLTLDGGALTEVAITDSYVSSRQSNNGYKAFRITDSNGDLVQPRASINGAPGWFIDVGGRTLLMTPQPATTPTLSYGPVLLDAHGDPAVGPFFAEAFVDVFAQLKSFVVAADDSLYLAPFPVANGDPTQSQGLLPVLSPEPGVPVRSFTLERTPIGTDGINRVRGYLVTSRDVFEYELSGTPPRWSSTLLPLSQGEPVEVWMDNPRGGLGRVGYRDGTVLTLPGGFVLAQTTPPQPPLQVLDYDNYGGWPVAYATDGLYFAQWGYSDAGLENKTDAGVPSIPMTWLKQTLPDGGEPWLLDGGARPAKLQVVQTTVFEFPDGGPVPVGYIADFDAGEQLHSVAGFQLFIYLDDAVYEVGQMERFNNHQVQPD